MNKSVLLPLADPLFSTYHNQGNAAGLLAQNPTIRNWYLNRAIVLTCNRSFLKGFSSPEIQVCDSTENGITWVERRGYPMEHLNGYVHQVIQALLEDGYTVAYAGIDDYYVRGKTFYHERHFNHDGLICGYDAAQKLYSLYAYDRQWMYRVFQTPKTGFEAGRKALFRQGIHGYICGIKAKPDPLELDPSEISKGLHEYLDSSLTKYPISGDGVVQGIAVQDYIAMYLDKLMDGSIPLEHMDWRIFRLIWEHKKVMLMRICAVEKLFDMGTESSDAYTPIVKESDTMRLLYASYHLKPSKSTLLPLIQRKMMQIRDAEEDILQVLVEKLDKAISC